MERYAQVSIVWLLGLLIIFVDIERETIKTPLFSGAFYREIFTNSLEEILMIYICNKTSKFDEE